MFRLTSADIRIRLSHSQRVGACGAGNEVCEQSSRKLFCPPDFETAEVKISDLTQWSTAEYQVVIASSEKEEITEQANVNSSAFGLDLSPLGFIREAAARCIQPGSNQIGFICSNPNGE